MSPVYMLIIAYILYVYKNTYRSFLPSFSASNVEGGLHTFSTIVVIKRCHMLIQAASFSARGFSKRTYH